LVQNIGLMGWIFSMVPNNLVISFVEDKQEAGRGALSEATDKDKLRKVAGLSSPYEDPKLGFYFLC